MLIFTRHLGVSNDGTQQLELVLDHDQRRRVRARVTASNGIEVGLVLPRGTVLRDGHHLATKQDQRALVRAAAEHVCVVVAHDSLQLAKVAYHLGNRHASVQFGSDCLYFLQDSSLARLCESLGGRVTEQWRSFDPEVLSNSAHYHSHGDE
jgi:urease accessory protein